MKKINKYEDMISLPHYQSKNHKRMPLINRASQFAPFSTLEGYQEAILNVSRLMTPKKMLDDDLKARLDLKMKILHNHLNDNYEIKITYFKKMNNDNEGFYYTLMGVIKRIDTQNKIILMNDSTEIKFEDIYDIDSNIFNL